MTLQEIYNKHQDHQIVLSFSNNNDVLITKDCFEQDSKFYRRSKIRLGMDFTLSAVIHKDEFITDTRITEGDVLIYRTFRGDNYNDYVVYVYTGEYKLLEHYKKRASYRRVIAQTDKQLTFNSITSPAPDKVLDICPHIKGKHYFVAYRNNGLKRGIHYSNMYNNDKPYEYLGYMLGVLVGLHTAKKYAGNITEVRVFCPNKPYAKRVYMYPLGYWKSNNAYIQSYVDEVNKYKTELQELGISICFMKEGTDVVMHTPSNVCPRCGGKGIFYTRVHNGVPVPAMPDKGVCYRCLGTGIDPYPSGQ